jgi:DNA-binding protein HU-beta
MALKKSAPAKAAAKPAAKKAAAKAPATKAAPTITLKHLAADLADAHELSKKTSEAVLNGMVDLVSKHLKKGDKVRITGLGILQVKKRAARMGRNPATGEAIKIKASKKLAFRAAKEIKDAI